MYGFMVMAMLAVAVACVELTRLMHAGQERWVQVSGSVVSAACVKAAGVHVHRE